jgi:hypothetical protein
MANDRYRLRAFIGSNGDVRRQDDLGFSTFSEIYVRRPDKYRYGVAETHDGRVITWDLYADDVLQSADQLTIIPPKPLREQSGDAPIEDKVHAAIMAAAMLAEEPQ